MEGDGQEGVVVIAGDLCWGSGGETGDGGYEEGLGEHFEAFWLLF